jgi:hypothetical protein
MVRQVIEQVERLHRASATRRDEPHSVPVEQSLARCLQDLRAIVALDSRDPIRQRPVLRIV